MFSRNLLSIVLASLVIAYSGSFAVTINHGTQLATTTFDYVIVGAGTAGLAVANRLTEDPNVTVLVLEAGVSDDGILAAMAPFLGPTLSPNTPFDWNYTVTAQAGMNGRSFPYPRGRILGGSSTSNYLIHQYGSSSDWDRYANVTRDSSWGWQNIQQYIQKHEQFVPPVDGHNTTNQFIPSLHGFQGDVKTTLPAFNQSIDTRVLATTQQLSNEFPFNEDTIGGTQSLIGLGFAQSSGGGGVRRSSSTSYLANANSRPGLTVLINATVGKLLQTGTNGALKSFRQVQFTDSPGTGSSPGGSATVVTARKEVILSAGSIGSVQILQLSGIGRASDLTVLGINSTIDNPSVGENLSDHALLPNVFIANDPATLDPIVRGNVSVIGPAVAQWTASKTGILANTIVNHLGFARIPPLTPILATIADPASGPNSPHYEYVPVNFFLNPVVTTPASGSFMTMITVLISPTSRGTVKIKTSNPFDKPLINPNFLTTNFDIIAMRESVKAVKRFVGAGAWSDYITAPFGALANANTDDEIDAYIRATASTIFHPVGTAAMASKDSASGVLNPDLTVKGADGLRVVDASAFPFIPSGHTQGPVYLLAERAADFIKAANA